MPSSACQDSEPQPPVFDLRNPIRTTLAPTRSFHPQLPEQPKLVRAQIVFARLPCELCGHSSTGPVPKRAPSPKPDKQLKSPYCEYSPLMIVLSDCTTVHPKPSNSTLHPMPQSPPQSKVARCSSFQGACSCPQLLRNPPRRP